jgi:hypothetical protein
MSDSKEEAVKIAACVIAASNAAVAAYGVPSTPGEIDADARELYFLVTATPWVPGWWFR